MITSIPENDILVLLQRQLGNMFMLSNAEKRDLEEIYPAVLKKVEYCFGKTANKYYSKILVGGVKYLYFNPFHSCQYTIFLYFCAKEIFDELQNNLLADKVYYLNKMLNGCDLFYQINLPAFWGCEHPCGSIMGRAEYGEGFFFYQCCTVGGNHGHYPVIGENVWMYAHSQIIGKCHIGDNVKLGAGCLVKDQDVPSDSLVFGQSPHLIIKPMKSLS